MRKAALTTLDRSLHLSVFSQEKIKRKDRQREIRWEAKGKRKWEGDWELRSGEKGRVLEMKLSPQVCQCDTISGRVFPLL